MQVHNNSYYYGKRERNTLVNEYMRNTLSYLKRLHPNVDNDVIVSHIKDIVREKMIHPECIIHDFVSDGNIVKRKEPLLSMIDRIGLDTIVTPNGMGYRQAKEHLSFFTEIILEDQAARKREKKIMLQAEIDGDEKMAKLKKRTQMNIKIGINAISGVMLANVFFRSANNYNAITSLARFAIQLSYSTVELFLMGNILLRTEDMAINFINRLLNISPSKETFDIIQRKYSLYIPTHEEVYNYFSSNLKIYCILSEATSVKALVNTLAPHELGFLYYAMNLKHLFQKNEFGRDILDRCFKVQEYKADDILDLSDGDLIICIVSMFPELLKKEGRDKPISLDDALNDKEIKERIANCYSNLIPILSELQDIFNLFVFIPFLIPNTMHQSQMIRKATVLSDTDSILFTVIDMVKWYTKSTKINSLAIKTNAVIIYLVTKLCEHMYAYMSACINVDEHNIKKVRMKNEFLYSVFLRSPMAKHYAGLNILKEGNVVNPPKLDKKGKNFIGSDLCKTTLKMINDTMSYLLNTAANENELDVNICLKKVVDFEQSIIKKLHSGNTEFLTQTPIKNESDYKIPMISAYFNYMFYQDCFAEKYGNINIPQKCKVVPIYPINYKNIGLRSDIKDKDPIIYDKICKFINKYPKKDITRILIPTNIDIPEELRSIIDYRGIVYKNCSSLYLIYRSIGICNLSSNKNKLLFSDIY